MPSLTLDDRLIWFAHCPKAGGTSVETVMVAQWGDRVGHLHWGWDLWWKRGGWRQADPPNSPQHLIWEDALASLPRPPDAVFALVRDPVERMLSEYRFQRRHRRGTRIGRALAYLPFALWIRMMLAMAKRCPHVFDNHLRPQADFVPRTATVFRLEDGVEQVLDWLAREGGADALDTLPHKLKSASNGTRIGGRERALIGAVFAKDYARFGYDAPARLDDARPVLDMSAAVLAPGLVWLDRRGRL